MFRPPLLSHRSGRTERAAWATSHQRASLPVKMGQAAWVTFHPPPYFDPSARMERAASAMFHLPL